MGSCEPLPREMESRNAPQSTKIGEETPCLPEQLIFEEILPRLPAKSLLKLRCVSKSWCSLIGSKRFIKAHLKYSINSSAHSWIFYEAVKKGMMQCSLHSLFYNRFTGPITHNAEPGIDFKCKEVSPVGCCNGLVCILVDCKRFILLNPTTKKFINLPDIFNQIKVKCEALLTYGFGYDELSDDYKVFGIVNAKGCIGMIYSLRSNSWKHVEEADDDSPFNNKSMRMGMYVSGKLHWISYGWLKPKGEIVSFDLNSHLCGVVELSSYMKGKLRSIRVIGGCLSAQFLHPNGDLDVWVMKEYGVKESWNKLMTITYFGHFEIPNPIAISPNGEVLLKSLLTIAIYDPKCNVLRHHQITASDDGFASVHSLGIYVESLASVAPDAQ